MTSLNAPLDQEILDHFLEVFKDNCESFRSILSSNLETLEEIRATCLAKHPRGINCLFIPATHVGKSGTWLSALPRYFMNYEEYCGTIAPPSMATKDTQDLLATVQKMINEYNPRRSLLWVVSSEFGDVLMFHVRLPRFREGN